MRYLVVVGAALLLIAGCAAPRVIDPATVILQDVPVPQGAVATNSSTESPEYSVPSRSVDDVVVFYMQRLPERGWVIDKRSSMLEDQPGRGKTRIVVGCRADGAFINAAIFPSGDAVKLLLQRSVDQLKCPS